MKDGKAPGQPSRLKDEHRRALIQMVEEPRVVRWRLIDLAQWIFEEYRISVTKQILSRELRSLGPASSQRDRAITRKTRLLRLLLKRFPRVVAAVAEKMGGKPIEVWFADEACIGQKNKITRRWAKRGTRPSAPRDQRTASAYIFGAKEGKGAALVLPSCNTDACAGRARHPASRSGRMAHLENAARAAQHNARATAGEENIWQFMRDNWLSNRIFKSYQDLLDHCCYAWNTLADQP